MSPLCSLNVNRLRLRLLLLLLLPTHVPESCVIRLPSALHFIVNVRIWSAHCAVAYIAIIIIMLRLIPHPISHQPGPSYRPPFSYVLHPSITAHVANIREPFGGRVESAKLFWDDDEQGFPHTPNILAHLSIYIQIYLAVCVYVSVCVYVVCVC